MVITRVARNSHNRDNWCLGVVGKRALLVRSLLSPCKTIREVGRFALLDIDVSGIPTDLQGLIRPGIAEVVNFEYYDFSRLGITLLDNVTESPTEDVTFHIEADWDGDPDNMLMCVRYKGRRINTINPAVADVVFCASMVPPIPTPLPESEITFLEWSAQDCLNRRPVPPNDRAAPYIMRIPGRPRLRYAALYWYHPKHIVCVQTNCLRTSIEDAKKQAETRRFDSYIVITGNETSASRSDWVPADIEGKLRKLAFLETTKGPRRGFLGDVQSLQEWSSDSE